MSDRPFESEVPSIDQVVDLLEAYADARLSPRGAVLARMRRHVIAEMEMRTALLEAERAARIAAARPKWWQTLHLRIPRSVAAAGMATLMVFGTSAAVLAAPPGSPLYNARVTLEQAFLPSGQDDRVAAHEKLLAERLREAQDAADAGNTVALQAALAAYQSEIDAAVADVGYDPELLAFLDSALTKHTALLETLAGRVPGPAADAIEKAIAASEKAKEKLHDKGGSKPPWAGQPGEHATPPPANGGDNSGGEGGDGSGHDGDDQGGDRNSQ
jgi:hypothetical protein